MNHAEKLNFLRTQYLFVLRGLDPNTPAVFGKMNVQQMIEHMTYSFRNASGHIALPALNDYETTQKMYRFMMSDKPFRDNTPNPNLPDEPGAPVHKQVEDSLAELQHAIELFVEVFKEEEKRILNPFFGHLNFEEWVHLLYKHASHHLRQFGVLV